MDNNFNTSIGAVGVPNALTLTGSAQDVRGIATLVQGNGGGLLFTNTSANPMYLLFSTGTVSATNYHYRLNANSQVSLPVRKHVPITVIGTNTNVLLVSTLEIDNVY